MLLERLFKHTLNELRSDSLVWIERVRNALVILAFLEGELLLKVVLLRLTNFLNERLAFHLGRVPDRLRLVHLFLAQARVEAALSLALTHVKSCHTFRHWRSLAARHTPHHRLALVD